MVSSYQAIAAEASPSARREWIEIDSPPQRKHGCICLPPRGGSGLKYFDPQPVVLATGLPPRGGSGLKLEHVGGRDLQQRSPSARREWIEISTALRAAAAQFVSLREEGVD